MPNYEYHCTNCRRRFVVFISYKDYGQQLPSCPHCSSQSVQRRIGRIRTLRSDESRLQNLANPASLANIDEDPRSLGKMMREMSREVGEEMAPEFDEVVGRLEAGQKPEEIEKELPELGSDDSGGALSGDMPDF